MVVRVLHGLLRPANWIWNRVALVIDFLVLFVLALVSLPSDRLLILNARICHKNSCDGDATEIVKQKQ